MPEQGSTEGSGAPDSHYGQDQKLYHWVYVAGITILTGVVDFAFLWPEWHLGALLVFATWLSLVAIYEFRNSTRGLAVTVPVLLFVGALIVNFLVDALTPIPERIVTGTLQAANDPRPLTGCDPASPGDSYWSPFGGFLRFETTKPKEAPPNDAIVVALGNNGIIVTKSESVPIIQVGECTLLSIQKTPNGLLVNASVFDLQGKLRAFLRDNSFTAIERGDPRPVQET